MINYHTSITKKFPLLYLQTMFKYATHLTRNFTHFFLKQDIFVCNFLIEIEKNTYTTSAREQLINQRHEKLRDNLIYTFVLSQ